MKQYTLSESSTIRESLEALNRIAHDVYSLLVVDVEGKMIGTLTDGDIRRGLISGAQFSDNVKMVMDCGFNYIRQSEFSVKLLKQFREQGVSLIPILDDSMRIVDVVNLQKYKSHLPIDAVLMAGGKGERLRPLTEKTPKPLLPVGDKCIIDHIIDRLISYGVNHVNVTVNYLKEQIEEHFQEPRHGVQIRTFREPQFLGTIGSIQFIDPFYNDTILVMNSDLFTNIDYEDFFIHFQSHNADMSVAAVPYNISVPYCILDLEGCEIKGLLEKPKFDYYINAGIYLIKKSLLQEIPKNEFFNATDLIEKLIAQKRSVIRYPLNGTWIDIGQPADLMKARDLVRHLK